MSKKKAMKLAYEVISSSPEKKPKKPCIILIHGLIESRKTWKIVGPQISKNTGRKVYAVDLRNHGESPWSKELSFDAMAEDIVEFMSDHDINLATIIGHSIGGRIAMTVALREPEKVEMLIIEDSVPQKFKPSPNGIISITLQVAKEYTKSFSDAEDEQAAKNKAREFFYSIISPELNDPDVMLKYHLDMVPLKKCGKKYTWQCDIDGFLDMVSTDKIEQDLSGVYEGHTLFLYGARSFFKTETDDLIPSLFPQASKMKIEGASHFIHLDYPELFVDEVSRFIKGHTKTSSKY